MRRSSLFLFIAVILILGACGDEPVILEELPLDSSVFDTALTETAGTLATDHVIDLALASPFYQSDGLKAQFKDQRYFEAVDQMIELLLLESQETHTHARALVAQIDQYQAESLKLIELWKVSDEALEPLYYEWLYRYSNQNAVLTLLQSEIDVLEDQALPPYQQAWVDYLLVGKRLLFIEQVVQLYSETTLDVIMVKEEMAERTLLPNDDHHNFNFDQSYQSAPQFDDSYERVVTSLDYLTRSLQKLTDMGDRFSIFLAESAVNMSADLEQSLNDVSTDQLTAGEKDFMVETTNIYQTWFTEKAAELNEQTDVTVLPIVEEEINEKWIGMPVVYAGGATGDFSEIVRDAEASVERVVSEEELGFFGRMKQKVLNVPGRLIERYNTVTYNYFFENYAEKLNVDQAVIKEVTDGVKREEARRVRDGRAGVAPVNQVLTWMEETEDQIIEAITSPLEGEDDAIVKTVNFVTKGFLKYGFGMAASGSKAMIGVLDQQASDEVTFRNLLTIAGSVFDFSKKTEQAINLTTSMLDDDVLELVEQEKELLALKSTETVEEIKRIKDDSYRHTDQVKQALFIFSATFDDVTYQETSYMIDEVIKEEKQRLTTIYSTEVAVGENQADALAENQGGDEDQGIEIEETQVEDGVIIEDQTDPADQQPAPPADREENQGGEDYTDEEALEDNTSSDPLINDNTLALKAGTYRGVFTGVDTDYGSLSADQMTNDRLP